MNITLIGMPGAGKSTVGVILAKVLGMNFLDTDLLLQQKSGRRLQQLLDTQGIAAFLALENAVVREITPENTVIATGGSVILGAEAMQRLKACSTILYLKLPLEELVQRLGNMRERGIAMPEGMNLAMLYQARIPLYEQYADVIVEPQGKSLEETVAAVVARLVPKM